MLVFLVVFAVHMAVIYAGYVLFKKLTENMFKHK